MYSYLRHRTAISEGDVERRVSSDFGKGEHCEGSKLLILCRRPETILSSQAYDATASNCDSLCHVLSGMRMVNAPSAHIVVVDEDHKIRALLRRVFVPICFRVR